MHSAVIVDAVATRGERDAIQEEEPSSRGGGEAKPACGLGFESYDEVTVRGVRPHRGWSRDLDHLARDYARRAVAWNNRAQRVGNAFTVGLLHSVPLTPIQGGPSLGGALEAAGVVGKSTEETAAKVAGQIVGVGVTVAVGAELNAAARAAQSTGASSRILNFTLRNLQKGFMKHGADFGTKGNWNPGRAADFSRAVNQHINSPGVTVLEGTYRGAPVTHYFDASTGVNVIADSAGNFVSGWRLGAEQVANLLRAGALQ